MNRIKSRFTRIFVIAGIAIFAICGTYSTASAADNLMPAAVDNINFTLRDKTDIVKTDDGYMRVCNDGKKTSVEYYDNKFNILNKKFIDLELDFWGGFYAGENAYYIVEGRNNTAESDTAEVIRIIKYDKDWNRLGGANITGNPDLFGGEVRYPFDLGCVEFAEYNGVLYVATAHEGYVDPAYNQGHQGYLLIAVDVDRMIGKIVDCDLWHSFAQYITNDESNLYIAQKSEGSGYTSLSRLDPAEFSPESTNTWPEYESISVFDYGGNRTSAWAIECYASVDGIALAADNVLTIGTSIDQSKYDEIDENTAHNIYLTITPKNNFTEDATTVKWLTQFKDGGQSFWGLKLTKVNDDKFMVSWEVADVLNKAAVNDTLSGNVLHYMFIDGNGNPISKEYTAAAAVSDCQPILSGNNIVYTASTENTVNFYSINSQSGEFSKKCYRVAGDYASWNLNNGVLTVSGKGEIQINGEADCRYSLSNVNPWNSYGASDNAWKPINEKIKKIIIKKGITSISERAFAGLHSLNNVNIESGVKTIEKEAFYGCTNMNKITIPASVTTIGEDILWDGFWWGDGSKVVEATIYAPKGSYAIKYAKANDISFVATSLYPAAPTATYIKLTGADDVKFSWNKVNGATGYKVYFKKASAKEWKSLGTTKNNYINKNNLNQGVKYTFKVVPYKVVDGKTYECKTAKQKSIYTLKKLNKPVVKKYNNTKVKVTWNNINGETGYQIARSTKKASGYKIVLTAKGKDLKQVTIKADRKVKYFYKVRAYKQNGDKKVFGPWSDVKGFKLK